MKKSTIGIIAGIGLLLLIGSCKYNGMVKSDQAVAEKWGSVQSAYQRRLDLITSLVDAVKAEVNFEKTTLETVVNARAKATSMTVDASSLTPEKLKAFQESQGELSTALGRFLSISEQYPNLKANAAFADLRRQVEGTENRINTARNDYNKAVKEYNVSVKTFPNVLFAGMFGFSDKAMFEADKGAEKAPKLNF